MKLPGTAVQLDHLNESERRTLAFHMEGLRATGNSASVKEALRSMIHFIGFVQSGAIAAMTAKDLGLLVGKVIESVVKELQCSPEEIERAMFVATERLSNEFTGSPIALTEDGKPIVSELLDNAIKELEHEGVAN